jgi:hypothetical protein
MPMAPKHGSEGYEGIGTTRSARLGDGRYDGEKRESDYWGSE